MDRFVLFIYIFYLMFIHICLYEDTPFCNNFHQMVEQSDHGKILFALLKPLFSGKVIFSPNNAAVQGVMSQVFILLLYKMSAVGS